MKHLELRALWLQQEVNKGLIQIESVPGTENPADLFTKPLVGRRLRELSEWCGLEFRPEPEMSVELIEPGHDVMMIESELEEQPTAHEEESDYMDYGLWIVLGLGILQLGTCAWKLCWCVGRMCTEEQRQHQELRPEEQEAELTPGRTFGERMADVRARGVAAHGTMPRTQ